MRNDKLITVLLTTIALVTLAKPMWASERPLSCPLVDDLKKNALMDVSGNNEKKVYLVGAVVNGYHTLANKSDVQQWTFVISVPYEQVANEVDAKNKAAAVLATLTGSPQPENNKQKWLCMYDNQYHYENVAMTPVDFPVAAH